MKRIVNPPPGPIKQATSQEEVDKFLSRKFNITQFLFDKQLAFVQDESPFKVAVCSRRSGKTIACAADLTDTAIKNPGSVCLYITLSKINAERIIWKDLKKINKDHGLGGIPREADLVITFPNGASIHLCGANNISEIENFRGVALKKVYIDECQSFREYIRDLIDDILAPTLIDYAGSLCLIGTPGPIPVGFFHECAVTSEAWSKHGWTFFDNPHLTKKSGKTHQQLLDRELKRRGVTVADPSIQREWFGKWVLDSDSLLIHYDPVKNHYQELKPNIKYNYIMGVDVGFKDADALSILAWSEDDPATYLVEELITTKQGLTELVEQIQVLEKKYGVYKIVMDMGGLGKKMGEEMIRRHSIPVEAADKARKMENIEVLNDALRSGRFKAKSDSTFAHDSYLVEIDRDKSTPDSIKVSSRFHSDIIDSVLYAFKVSYSFAYEAKKEPPKRGTKEWAEAQQNSMFEATLEGLQQEQEFNKRYFGEE